MDMATPQANFKIIIAGGSLVGLTLALMLERAGIDFVVLEKGDVGPDLGASISVLPQTARVLEQLGLWHTILARGFPVGERHHIDSHGRLHETSYEFGLVAARLGRQRPCLLIERKIWICSLWEALRDAGAEAKVRTRAGVADFVEDDDGVTVTTTVGDKVRGSVLVGADGVHSMVRRKMADAVSESDPERARNLREAFTSSYRCIVGKSRNQRGDSVDTVFVPPAVIHTSYCRGVSGISSGSGDGHVYWFLCKKEDRPTTTPHTPRFTDADCENTIHASGATVKGTGYTFRDLWDTRVRTTLVAMEEGIVKGAWNSGGRVVLMGDAVAKATINAGLGGNTHVEGVCHFVNALVPVLRQSTPARTPTAAELKDVFDTYEQKHRPRCVQCGAISGAVTRLEAMATWYWRLVRMVRPYIPASLQAYVLVNFLSGAPSLDFLPPAAGDKAGTQ